MRRFFAILGLALVSAAIAPNLAQAQVIYSSGHVYTAPVVVSPPVVTSYYAAPSATYSYYPSTSYYYPSTSYSYYPSTTYSYYPSTTYSYYPSTTVYSAPVVTYPAPVVTYAAPTTVYAPGYYETRTSYGYGILRPRGYSTQTYYRP